LSLPKTMIFCTIKRVAEHLGVSTRTVRRWIERGELVAHRFGSAVRIADRDLLAFLAVHRESWGDVSQIRRISDGTC